MSALQLTTKFYAYQKTRFPILPLLLSFLPAILSSTAVVSSAKPSMWQVILGLLAAVAYLFHIRVTDEHRDFAHDSTYHKTRPVQSGIISLAELKKIDKVAVSIFGAVALSGGNLTFGIALISITYTYFAGKEFYLGEKIRRRFFLYNAVNIVQMLLLQMFIYGFYSQGPFAFNAFVATHFAFTALGAVLFEFLRKLKIPKHESAGNDTYSARLGFRTAVLTYASLVLIDTLLFFRLAQMVASVHGFWFLLAGFSGILLVLWTFVHSLKKTDFTERVLQVLTLSAYGLFNVTIYFLKF